MKNIPAFILVTIILLISCTKNEDEITEKSNRLKISFKSEKETAEIFELANFYFVSNNDFDFLELRETYDSLVWNVKNIQGTQKLYSHTPSSSNFIFNWSTNFFYPGSYTIYLFGYKNNQIVQKDSINFGITNSKDFLGYDWAEITDSDKYNIGYHDAFSNYNFSTRKTKNDGITSVTLLHMNDKDQGDFDYAGETKKILYDYICKIYSQPTYIENDNKDLLMEKYKTLFKSPQANTVPVCIWITKTSNIALIDYLKMDYYNSAKFRIYAEPKN